MDARQIIKQAEAAAPSWTSEAEREEMIRLAQGVKAGGRIVEIGGLYGGMTAVLALANPEARVTVVDEFSWSPLEDRPKASAAQLLENVKRAGVTNVDVVTGDSRRIGKTWKDAIDLLWIDGGHSYEFVKSDLDKFGKHAGVIALHDYDNPFWESIRRAVEDYLKDHPEWMFDHHVDTVAVLTRVR